MKNFISFVLAAGVVTLTGLALFKFLTDKTWGQVWDWILFQLPQF